MADPNQPKTIGVKVPGASTNDYVKIRNLTRGGTLDGKLAGSDRNIVFNKAPGTEWVDGDVVQAEIAGTVSGAKQGTLSSGGVTIKITATADSSTPGVSL